MPNRPSAALAGTVCYAGASVLWGLNIPLTAALLQDFDPFWLPPLRYLIAATVLGAWLVATLGAGALRSPIAASQVALLGGAVSAFLVCFTVGLLHTHPITAAALIAGSPVYVAVVSRAMTGARLAKGFVGATLLTLLGAGIAIAGRAQGAGSAVGLQGGEPLLIASIVCWTVYSILAQRWFDAGIPQLQRTFLSSAAAIPWLLVFWLLAGIVGVVGMPNLSPTPRAAVYLLITAVFCTAIATVAWNVGVSRLGIAVGGMWQNTVPVFAVLISLVFFGVMPTAAQVLGGTVVLAGVLWMQWHTVRGARPRSP